jgi:hypothetical protein
MRQGESVWKFECLDQQVSTSNVILVLSYRDTNIS